MGFAEQDLTRDAFLGGKLHLWQPKDGYRAATDPVFLAAACPAKSGQSVLELGCGGGTASLCLARRVDVALTGIELQADYAELARRNADHNGLAMQVETADLTNLPAAIRNQNFDHVMLNPPFYGPGTKAQDQGRATALHQHTPLEDWLMTAMKRLKPKGWLTIIHLADRLGDLLQTLNPQASRIDIKPLAARNNRPAKRVILRVRKGRDAVTTLHNPLILHMGERHISDGDSYTDEVSGILRNADRLKFN